MMIKFRSALKTENSSTNNLGLRWNIVVNASFVVIALFLFWRAKYGYMFNDEPFCVTLAQRLWQGEALIVHEWHGAQNFGVVLLPLFGLFKLLFNTTTGILLAFRYVYCALWLIVCRIVCESLRKYGYLALLATIYLLLFSPLDYMTLSYTSIGLMSVLLVSTLLYGWISSGVISKKKLFFLGILISITALCCPAMAICYILYTFSAFALYGISGMKSYKQKLLGNWDRKALLKPWCYITLGISVMVTYYLALLLPRVSLQEISRNLRMIFSDPEHKSINFIKAPIDFLYAIYISSPVFCVLIFICFLLAIASKKIKNLPTFLFIVCSVAWVLQAVIVAKKIYFQFNYQMLSIVLVGTVAFVMIKKKPWTLFAAYFIVGGCYAFCSFLMSNTGVFAVSAALSVAGVFSIICIGLLAKQIYAEYTQGSLLRGIAIVLAVTVLWGQIVLEFYVRTNRTYWDEPLPMLTQTIQDGPAKGLVTNIENSELYEQKLDALNGLLMGEDTAGKKLLVWNSMPWVYLAADMNFATFSAWTFGYEDGLSDRLKAYFSLHPGNEPDFILVYDYASGEQLDQVEGYRVKYRSNDALLIKNNL